MLKENLMSAKRRRDGKKLPKGIRLMSEVINRLFTSGKQKRHLHQEVALILISHSGFPSANFSIRLQRFSTANVIASRRFSSTLSEGVNMSVISRDSPLSVL